MTDQTTQPAGWPARSAGRFFTIWIGQQFSLVGSTLAQFALVWWLTQTTGSATILATATAVAILPNVFLGPFVGVWVDRWSRRAILIAADGLVALASAVLALLFWSGAIQVWQVYLVLLVRAVGDTFHWPAMTATTPLMVPEQHLPRVAGLNQALSGAVNIIAPPLGALLLSLLPLHQIMVVDVATAALAIVPLCFVCVPQPARSPAAGSQGRIFWADFRAGLAYVWGWPGLRALIVYSLLLNLVVNPPMELLPLLVTQHFGGQAIHLGWLNSAWGVGIVAGGLLLGAWSGFRRRMLTMLAGVVGLGVGVLLVGLAPADGLTLALGGLFVGAVANAMSNAAMFAVLQQAIAPEVQGRVFAFARSLATAAMPLGLLAAGPLADAVGVRALFWGAGIIYILLGAGAFFVPVLLAVENGRDAQPLAAG